MCLAILVFIKHHSYFIWYSTSAVPWNVLNYVRESLLLNTKNTDYEVLNESEIEDTSGSCEPELKVQM